MMGPQSTPRVNGAYCGWGRYIPAHGTANEILYRNEYCNYDYAYRVLLPKDVVAHGSMPPSPNHGFGVLPAEPESSRDIDAEKEAPYLYVDASYGWMDDPSLKAAFDWYIEQERTDGMKLVSRKTTVISGLPAIRATFNNGSNFKLLAVAYRKKMNVVYTIELTTSRDRLSVDESVFDNVVKGFRLQRRPNP